MKKLYKNLSKKSNKLTGRIGEIIAAKYLSNKGYNVLTTNWHTRFGEIDLVCVYKKTLVFIEVKTKTNLNYGTPENMINSHKLRQIVNTSSAFCLSSTCRGIIYTNKRIDIISIVLPRSYVNYVKLRKNPLTIPTKKPSTSSRFCIKINHHINVSYK